MITLREESILAMEIIDIQKWLQTLNSSLGKEAGLASMAPRTDKDSKRGTFLTQIKKERDL